MAGRASVVSSAKLIAVCTLASRVTGLARDVLLAQAFGLGWVQDAFSYAFQLPNLLRRLFGEGAMAPVFVPTFTRTLETEGRPAAWRLLARTLALMTLALVAIGVLIALIIAAVWLTPTVPEKAAPRSLLLGLTLVMLPFMLSICVLALLSSILNCLGSFVPAAAVPIVLNVVMIAALAGVAPRLFPGQPEAQVYVVAVSVLVAGAAQLVFLYPALRRRGVELGWRFEPRDPTVQRMLALLGPVALGQGVLAFGVFLDAQICTLLTHVRGTPETTRFLAWSFTYPLTEGALSAVTYAQRLYQFPLGVLVISLATAALPEFSRLAARGAWPAWTAEVRQSFRLAVFEGLLAGVMMIVLAEPLTRLLFERGNFTPEHTVRASHVLMYYGLAMWAFCAQHIVSRAFYSLGDVRTPLAISVVCLPLNVAISLALVWFEGIREAAFAISSTVTSSLAVVAGLLALQRRTQSPVFDRSTLGALARMVFAAAAAAAALLVLRPLVTAWTQSLPQGLLRNSVETLGLLAAGTAVFVIAAAVLRLGEVRLLAPRRRRGEKVTT
ncbi:MAG: murein biosynthesis integral membrane protein MurJ [Phycisphaerales bacterium]|nr:murein biosynthesis integral membrane protein MurJ [Phycisphaerales bacterium]